MLKYVLQIKVWCHFFLSDTNIPPSATLKFLDSHSTVC